MPCPFFEPTTVAPDPKAAHARLPLLAEHEGLCHATGTPVKPDPEWRFGGCNHGREQERCPRFPPGGQATVRRFTVTAQSETTLSVLVCEEVEHVPVRWRQVEYCKGSREVLAEPADVREAAQTRAFCAAYLQRFC